MDNICTFLSSERSHVNIQTCPSSNLCVVLLLHFSLSVIDVIGEMYTGETWGSCPITMVMNHIMYCGTVSHGQPRILKPVGSEVCLNIPSGSSGVYKMGVHTDSTKYDGIVSKEECVISPVVKVIHQESNVQNKDEEPGTHLLSIPHCLRDRSLFNLMRVKKADIEHSIPFQEIPQKDEDETDENSFSVGPTHVRVSCRSFSEFVCTTCKTTCQSTLRAFIFANLRPWPNLNITTLEVKSFLCSYLFRIDDFRQVSG